MLNVQRVFSFSLQTMKSMKYRYINLLQLNLCRISDRCEQTAATRVLSATRSVSTASQIRPLDLQTANSSLNKRKLLRKKQKVNQRDHKNLEVVAFCTAKEYHLCNVIAALREENVYDVFTISDEVDDAICVRSKYDVHSDPKEIFLFSSGTTVFWNVPLLEQKAILRFIKGFENKPHANRLVEEEKEDLVYEYTPAKTRVNRGIILLQNEYEETIFEKYTVSNALSLSVQLALWEAILDDYIDSIKWITEDMIRGNRVKLTREQVFSKTGELFNLRHCINLDSDLLDTPDFYWDREQLEDLFHATCSLFSMSKRTRVMNEKLNHCCELMELLSHHLNDKHHVRLEWMIIALIMVEVLFEIIGFLK